jgi:hypothetical protein
MGNANVFAETCDQYLKRIRFDDFILKRYGTAFEFFDPAADGDTLSIAGGLNVTGTDLDDGQVVATALEAGVIAAALPGIIAAPFLEIDDITGMMHDTHCISLGIADVKGGFCDEMVGDRYQDCPSLNT